MGSVHRTREREKSASSVASARRLGAWVVLSCALHGLVGSLALGAVGLERSPRARVDTLPDQLEFALEVSPPTLHPAVTLTAVPARPATSAREPRKAAQLAPVAVAASRAAVTNAAAAVAPAQAVVQSAAVPKQSSLLDLSPTQAARAFVAQSSDAPAVLADKRAGAFASAGSVATNASVAASLQARAVTPAGDSEPRLSKRSDGSYAFKGNGFDATIRPDGSLKMREVYGRAIAPLVPFQLPDGSWRVSLGGAGFDLSSYVEHLVGNDPHLSERRWFLSKTLELRERLAQRAADAATRARLLRLWSTRGLSFEERRQRVFSIWDECADDVVGEHGRAVIERYVGELCPPEQACAFTEPELAALNARRKSRRAFAPYAAASEAQR
ncbi:MAG: hypothetical protein JWN04_3809 [Myxococcaceae bacterium]|nr:hypothetical protein [Myxococcaceae bacterium]